jgi:hypothetical protein
MKNLLIFLILLPTFLIAQDKYENTPKEYWITDSNFEEKINGKSAFSDDDISIVIVEFWANFNKDNCFDDWDKLENVKYYRIDIANAPIAKKQYRVRMAPTLIIFKDGEKYKVFKAGLDLVLKEDILEIQESINEANTASQY